MSQERERRAREELRIEGRSSGKVAPEEDEREAAM